MKTRGCANFIAVIVSIPLFCGTSIAQNYVIDWSKISGGGGISTNGLLVLDGTIGQHNVDSVTSGGSYSIAGGFWALYAVGTLGVPSLTIIHSSSNIAVITWPSASSTWILQQNTNGLGSINWSNITTNIQDNGATKSLIVSPLIGKRYYRLRLE